MIEGEQSAIVAPRGGGVFELGDAIVLGGEVARAGGGRLEIEWRAGDRRLLPPDVMLAAADGAPTAIPEQVFSTLDLGLGLHRVDLVVVVAEERCAQAAVEIEIAQPGRPTLAPIARPGILWPPDGRAADVWLEVRGADRHGRPPALEVDLGSAAALGAELRAVDEKRGLVHLRLRAARRIAHRYRIAVTATDDAGRTSSARADVVAPARGDAGPRPSSRSGPS